MQEIYRHHAAPTTVCGNDYANQLLYQVKQKTSCLKVYVLTTAGIGCQADTVIQKRNNQNIVLFFFSSKITHKPLTSSEAYLMSEDNWESS